MKPMLELDIPDGAGFPCLTDEVALEPVPERPGSVLLSARGGLLELELDAGSAWVARAFDGTRTLSGIARAMERDGTHRSARFIEELATYLADFGALTFLDTPRAVGPRAEEARGESFGGLRHACKMCGRSCQGQFIGPLDTDTIARMPEVHRQMAELHPDLRGLEPMRSVRDGASMALTARGPDERCIYLGDRGQCRIHAALGPEAKPLVCRLFPLVRVATEQGVRSGISPRCYHWIETWRGPDQTPAELTGVDALPWPLLQSMETRPEHRQGQPRHPRGRLAEALDAERALLDLLRDEGATFWNALQVACAHFLEVPDVQIDRAAFVQALRPRLQRLGASLIAENGPILPDPPPQSHQEEVSRLAKTLRNPPEAPFEGLTDGTRAFGLHLFGQWLHLREWSDQPSYHAGVFTLLAGLVAASWSASQAPPESREARFGLALAAWVRALRQTSNVHHLFEGWGDVAALVEATAS